MSSQGGHQNNKESHGTIELRVEEISQLFDNLDPFPFRERDLDKDAEAYIVGWARELPRRQPLSIIVHLPRDEAETRQAGLLGEAMKGYFANRAEAAQLELKELYRVGRRSLYIGVCVLAACLLLGQIVSGRLGTGYLGRFVEESLVILGWVANWKPMEIMLYDWLPIKRRLDLYRRLARAEVGLKPYDGTMRPNPF
ncbi:MAG: hypothetical protein WAW96_12085 [Alphaproteobacteria bacterium]